MVRDHLRLRRKAATALSLIGVLIAAWLLAAGPARADFSYVGSIGGVTQDEFFYPSDVATDVAGNLYVADTVNNRIRRFTSAGVPAGQWTVHYPTGVAVSGDTVYVALPLDDVVATFSLDGGFKAEIPAPDLPQQVAIDSGGGIYVTRGGGYVAKLGGWATKLPDAPGNNAARIYGITVGPDGELYVADLDHGIRRLSRASGALDGTISLAAGVQPYDLAFAGDGSIYVTDWIGDHLLRITSGGTLVGQWGVPKTRDNDGFDRPQGVAVFGSAIYVADNNSHRVVRWGEPVAGDWPSRPAAVVVPPAQLVDKPAAVLTADDRTAPTVKLTMAAQRLRAVLSRGLVGKVRTSEAGRVTIAVTVDKRTARNLRLGKAATVIGRASVKAAATGTATVRVKLTSKARKALHRAHSVRVIVKLTVTDAAGNAARPVVRAITLR
jgi:sugar lactone lactonase YvrE